MIERFGEQAQEERVRRELTLVGKSHPHLVQIFDGGRCATHNVFYIVMEYIPAAPLSDLLSAVPRQQIWNIAGQIASAARFLEDLSLCHRDIKPGNIAVSSDFETVTVLDLGVLRPFDDAVWTPVTDEEQISFIGTLQYSSPEALFRLEDNTRNGWRALTFYQIGAVLHDLIMKVPIFNASASPYPRLVEAVRNDIPTVQASDVIPDLVLLARNCLAKEPSVRLSLVRWEDFEPRQPDLRASIDAKERMRRRRAQTHQLATEPSHVKAEKDLRQSQRILSAYQLKLEEIIREECIGNDLFPLMTLKPGSLKNSLCILHCAFPRSLEHNLDVPLHIHFSLTLVDATADVVRLTCAAVQTNDELPLSASDADHILLLFHGVFEEHVISRTVRDILYVLFDRAQAGAHVNEHDFPRWLTSATGEANG